jgi:hypothetical protein
MIGLSHRRTIYVVFVLSFSKAIFLSMESVKLFAVATKLLLAPPSIGAYGPGHQSHFKGNMRRSLLQSM